MRTPSPLAMLALLASAACDDAHGGTPDGGRPDAGSPDGGRPDPGRPLSCTPNAYVGDGSFTGTLVVQPGNALCAQVGTKISYGDLSEREAAVRTSLAAAIAGKSVVTVAAGTYGLPRTDTTLDLALPLCVEDGVAPGVATGTAEAATVFSSDTGGFGAARGHQVRATVPLGNESLEVSVLLDYDTYAGTLGTVAADDHRVATAARGDRLYVPCSLAPTNCTELTFGSLATVRLDEYVWRDSPGRGFAAPVHVAGTVMGTTLYTSRYEDLTTTYGHHAFDRYTFVRFSAPIGGACGLRIDLDVSETWQAALADCAGVPIASATSGVATAVDCR